MKNLPLYLLGYSNICHYKSVSSKFSPFMFCLNSYAMPLFALMDASGHTGKMIWNLCILTPKKSQYHLLQCKKSLSLFVLFVLLTPKTLISPQNLDHYFKLNDLKEELSEWITNDSDSGKKLEAAQRIFDAFAKNKSSLNLLKSFMKH